MQSWVAWFVSLITTAVNWMTQMTIFDVPLIGIIAAVFVMGVMIDALLYKA